MFIWLKLPDHKEDRNDIQRPIRDARLQLRVRGAATEMLLLPTLSSAHA